jgi:nitrogen regulatory protein P-II 1
MQRIEAIIRPEKILDVKAALEELGYPGMTVTEVKGHGTQRGVKQEWNGQEFWIEFLPKLWFLIVVDDKDLDAVVDAILDNAHTGETGDGKIFVSEVKDVIRVRTRERGLAAIKGEAPLVTPS